MNISLEETHGILICHLSGRIDAYTSQEVSDMLEQRIDSGNYKLVLNLNGVEYLSSAGIRVLLVLKKKVDKRKGDIKLACVQSYPLDVLKISGVFKLFSLYKTVQEATASFPGVKDAEGTTPEAVETQETSIGVLNFTKGDDNPSEIRVTGSNLDFLYAKCSEESITSESLANIKYSLGVGALGERVDDYINRLGELLTVGGTVIWTPTDGHNTPDYLIPKGDAKEVKVHTVFNIILDGIFNEVVRFEASDQEKGVPLKAIYQELFELTKKRVPGFKGVLGLVMRADVGGILGAGIKRSPIIANAPENGELITHQDNIKDWLNFQVEPEHENTTALVVGVSALGSDFDPSLLQSVFYIPPKSKSRLFSIARFRGKSKETDEPVSHNHAAIFQFLPEANSGYQLENEVANVIENGRFIGMEHLLDSSTFKKGVLGLSYIQGIVNG